MTRSERLVYAETSTLGTTAFVFAAARAGLDQAVDRPQEWQQGARGFGLRYGSVYGEYFIGQTFEHLTAYGLHEDNRYFASGQRGLARRLGYAIGSTFLARHDDGSRSISISGIGGAGAAAWLSRQWQPRSTTSNADAAVSFGLTLGVRAGLNILREFSPRLERILR